MKLEPKNTRWFRDLSLSHDKIGDAFLQRGARLEALTEYRQALAIAEQLAALDPDNRDWQRDVAVSYWTIARVLADQNQTVDALTNFQSARERILALLKALPDDAEAKNDLDWLDDRIAELQHPAAARQ